MAKNDNYREISELTSIVESKALSNLLAKRKEFLQREANSFVRNGNLTEAFGSVAKLDDCDKLIDIMKLRIKNLNKEDNDNG